jgi:hypothetical protein
MTTLWTVRPRDAAHRRGRVWLLVVMAAALVTPSFMMSRLPEGSTSVQGFIWVTYNADGKLVMTSPGSMSIWPLPILPQPAGVVDFVAHRRHCAGPPLFTDIMHRETFRVTGVRWHDATAPAPRTFTPVGLLADYREALVGAFDESEHERWIANLLRTGKPTRWTVRWWRVAAGLAATAGLLAAACALWQSGLKTQRELRDRALAKGRCPKCGYDVTAAPEPRCPECGNTLE